MKKSILRSLCALAALLCLTACAPRRNALQGKWEGSRFTDKTLHLAFTLPEDWTALDSAAVMELTGLTDISAYRLFLMRDDGNINLQLSARPAQGQDADAYLAAMQENMQQAAGTPYHYGTVEGYVVGGVDYRLAPAVAQAVLAPNGDSTVQWLLARAQDDQLVCLGITFAASLQDQVEQLLTQNFEAC